MDVINQELRDAEAVCLSDNPDYPYIITNVLRYVCKVTRSHEDRAQKLWQTYRARLCKTSDNVLPGEGKGIVSPNDIAGAGSGRFRPWLVDFDLLKTVCTTPLKGKSAAADGARIANRSAFAKKLGAVVVGAARASSSKATRKRKGTSKDDGRVEKKRKADEKKSKKQEKKSEKPKAAPQPAPPSEPEPQPEFAPPPPVQAVFPVILSVPQPERKSSERKSGGERKQQAPPPPRVEDVRVQLLLRFEPPPPGQQFAPFFDIVRRCYVPPAMMQTLQNAYTSPANRSLVTNSLTTLANRTATQGGFERALQNPSFEWRGVQGV